MQTWDAELAYEASATLGEGALWDAATQRLWWIDIYGQCLFRTDPRAGQTRRFELDSLVTSVVLGKSGDVVLALRDGLASFEPGRPLRRLVDVERTLSGNRLNDGKCDPNGRLWIGSMVESGDAGGAALYCVDDQLRVRPLLEQLTLSNGLAWADAGRTFYHIDSPTQSIVRYDCELASPTLHRRSVVFRVPDEMGMPDGMCIDERGQLWVALFGGQRVVCVDPRLGQITAQVRVPAKNVTSCAFGGSRGTTLFITTARLATSDDELARWPLAGSLFCVDLPVAGTPYHRFSAL